MLMFPKKFQGNRSPDFGVDNGPIILFHSKCIKRSFMEGCAEKERLIELFQYNEVLIYISITIQFLKIFEKYSISEKFCGTQGWNYWHSFYPLSIHTKSRISYKSCQNLMVQSKKILTNQNARIAKMI